MRTKGHGMTGTEAERRSARAGRPPANVPPSARVPENRWDQLEVPAVGALDQWRPTLSVSVVIPAYNAHASIGRCLAALRLQTYPHELVEVVIADDGSEPPMTVPDEAGDLRVAVHRQEHLGFGAGRARNLGARHARGDVLLFLDADMLLEPRTLEAHMRWHHAAADVVTLGARRHADFSDVDAASVARLDGQAGWEQMVAGREQWSVEWIDSYMARYDRMRRPDDDAFRLTTAANIGIGRWLFDEIGGFSAFGIRGIEDTEVGYRLWNAGALMIWDVDARGWHDGRSFFQGEKAAAAKEERRSVMADHLPVARYRRAAPGRVYAVPRAVVHMTVFDEPAVQVVAAVEAVLGWERHDVLVDVVRSPDAPATARIDRHFAHEPRVRLGDGTPVPEDRRSPLQIWVPPEAWVSPATLTLFTAHLTAGECGVVHATVPGLPPSAAMLRAVRTRALARAERLAERPSQVDALIGELFGERWYVGADLGVRRLEADGVPVAEEGQAVELRHLALPEAVAEAERRVEALTKELRRVEKRLAGVPRPRTSGTDELSTSRRLARKGLDQLRQVRSVDDVKRLARTVQRRLSA